MASFVLSIRSMMYDRGDYQVEIAAICLVSDVSPLSLLLPVPV